MDRKKQEVTLDKLGFLNELTQQPTSITPQGLIVSDKNVESWMDDPSVFHRNRFMQQRLRNKPGSEDSLLYGKLLHDISEVTTIFFNEKYKNRYFFQSEVPVYDSETDYPVKCYFALGSLTLWKRNGVQTTEDGYVEISIKLIPPPPTGTVLAPTAKGIPTITHMRFRPLEPPGSRRHQFNNSSYPPMSYALHLKPPRQLFGEIPRPHTCLVMVDEDENIIIRYTNLGTGNVIGKTLYIYKLENVNRNYLPTAKTEAQKVIKDSRTSTYVKEGGKKVGKRPVHGGTAKRKKHGAPPY